MSNLTFRLVSCTWGNKNEDPKSRRYEVIMLTNICTARPLASGDRYTPQPQWLRCRNETDDFYWKQWVIYMNIVSCIVWQNISSLEFCRQTIKTLCTAQWKYVSDEGLSSNNSGKLIKPYHAYKYRYNDNMCQIIFYGPEFKDLSRTKDHLKKIRFGFSAWVFKSMWWHTL